MKIFLAKRFGYSLACTVIFLVMLLPASSFSREVPAIDFWLCYSERAIGVMVHSLRIHESKNKNHCLVIYTRQGLDEVLVSNQWLSICQKALQNKITELTNTFWDCNKQNPIYVFYPKKIER